MRLHLRPAPRRYPHVQPPQRRAAPPCPSARAAASSADGARAAASRANGAKSRGPRTAEGKARSAQNALKHGLCAKKHVLLPDDSRAEFKALESALLEDLRPAGALQTLLAHRLVAAVWRLARADRLEFGLLAGGAAHEGPGRALVRDGRAAAAFAMLVRYRGGAQAELFRILKLLKELQAAATDADPIVDASAGPAADPGADRRPRRSSRARPGPGRPSRRCLRRPPPAPLPLGATARTGTPNRAGVRRPLLAGIADAPRDEPENAASGHRCAANATRNEPGRPARDAGPGAQPPARRRGPRPDLN